MKKRLTYKFPNESPHEGIPLGNGNFGALIWGRENRFHLTINRQDYWNHRGNIVWGKNASYKNACKVILNTPACMLRSYEPDFIGFEKEGMPRPTRMPLGRFDLICKSRVKDSILDMANGLALLNGKIIAFIPVGIDILYIDSANFAIEAIPNNSKEVVEYRKKYDIPEPELFEKNKIKGWTQENPGDLAICAAALKRKDAILVTAVLAETAKAAIEKAETFLNNAESFEKAQKKNESFFGSWWKRSPEISIEFEKHQILYEYGMYRLAGFTQPGTPAPTLQGPWIEDDRMPPWQSDYHFNINVQMAHWPMLAGGHFEQFEPLEKMLKSWLPKMREYAEKFVGIKDGIMLPHGCDDRCCPADTNWKCQFDAGSAGWTALMFWDLYRYCGKKQILSSLAYPMMRGALRVYETMIEQTDGQSFYAPSPEYVPANGYAWGRNPSFHLAIIHALLKASLKTVEILGIREEKIQRWKKMSNLLPKAALQENEILIWEGLPLRESHRHHSHLAGIYPFDIFDINGAEQKIVEHSLWLWTGCGTGGWTGWCTPWATIIWARLRNSHAAFYLLDQYERFFTGPNYFGSHNAFYRGFSCMLNERPPYIMQMDGICGATTAILEMLAHEQNGEIILNPAAPAEWGEVKFDRIYLPNGKIASGKIQNGKTIKAKVSNLM